MSQGDQLFVEEFRRQWEKYRVKIEKLNGVGKVTP
jgi:hypothetical protein